MSFYMINHSKIYVQSKIIKKNWFTQKIVNRLSLFQNLRPIEEDVRIFEKVHDLCFEEMLMFIEENLDLSRKSFLFYEIDELSKKNDDDDKKAEMTIYLIFKYLTAIPHYRFRLNKRLDFFINKLIVKSKLKK